MTFTTNAEVDKKLEAVAEDAGYKGKMEVVKKALSLYTFCIEHKLIGYEFYIRDLKGELQPLIIT